jgi:ribulose-phosphate 3-epimerase
MEATCGCFSYFNLTPDVNNHTADPLPLIDAIHERKMKAGVAISPDTPSSVITDEIAAAADMLLVMTVYPGT